jgi:hypothetical protein
MDSFTLGLLSKIDFKHEHSNNTPATARELADLHNISINTSLSYKEFYTEFCKEYMPRSFYL